MVGIESPGITPRQRMAAMLLEELRTGAERWWCITFDGGDCVLVPGKGPTDAWHRMHGLNLHVEGSTGTHGPIDPTVLAKVPPDMRLVRLPKTKFDEVLG